MNKTNKCIDIPLYKQTHIHRVLMQPIFRLEYQVGIHLNLKSYSKHIHWIWNVFYHWPSLILLKALQMFAFGIFQFLITKNVLHNVQLCAFRNIFSKWNLLRFYPSMTHNLGLWHLRFILFFCLYLQFYFAWITIIENMLITLIRNKHCLKIKGNKK